MGTLELDAAMKHEVTTKSLRELSAADRYGMFNLRFQTFSVRLGWDVKVTGDEQEIDEFDQVPSVRYVVARAESQDIDACWRLLPSVGPNMLRDVFPGILNGLPVPAAADIWEISRFAVASDRLVGEGDLVNPAIGFGDLSIELMREAARFAQQHSISRYVAVTTTSIERMLKKRGLHIHRLAPPIRIGAVMTVACFIEVDDVTLTAINL